MKKSIQKATAGLITGVIAFSGLAVFSPVNSSPFAAKKAVAACSVSKFQITWGQVGVRHTRDINSQIDAYRYYGQIVYGATGGTYAGMTQIVYDAGGAYVNGYIPEGSRAYISCQ